MKRYLFFLLYVLFLNNSYIAQEKDSPIIIHPVIGDKLDRVENDYFELFPMIVGFQEATFYLNPDSTLKVWIKYKSYGLNKDTLIQNYLPYEKLRNYLEYKLTEEVYDAKNIERGWYANVFTVKDSVIEGELLAVNSSSIMMLNLDRASYNRNNEPPFDVSKIYNSEVSKLTFIEETNIANIIYPLVLGIGVGLTAGFIKQAEIESEEPGDLSTLGEDLFAPVLYYLIGAAAGALIGYILSEIFPIITTSEIEYSTPFSEEEVRGLSSFSRYKE